VVKALTHIEEGCSCCILGKDSSALAMSDYSKSKDDMQDSLESDGESGNIGSSSSITENCKNLKL
jgi:hypothetical protein